MFEIYTCLYNSSKFPHDWRDSLENFCEFASRVTIAVNQSEDDTLQQVKDWKDKYQRNLNIVETNFSYSDLAFDGKIKNAALQACEANWLIGLDIDERIPVWQLGAWENLSHILNKNEFDAALIPSVNLCKNLMQYKDIGPKWYLHKRGFHRGIVEFAKKQDGKIDIKKSDTTELIDDKGNLVKTMVLPFDIETLRERQLECPLVFHLGWVSKTHRLAANEFWKPHWENRAGHVVDDIITTEEQFDKIDVQTHGLTLW